MVGRAVPDDYYTLWYRSDRCGADLRHDYYYSDSLFDHPATEYDNQLALATLGMAAAADCTWESDQRYWMEGEVGRADISGTPLQSWALLRCSCSTIPTA